MEIDFGIPGWSLEDSEDPFGFKFDTFLDDDPPNSGFKLQEWQGSDALEDLQPSVDCGSLADDRWLDTKVDLIDIIDYLPSDDGQLDIMPDIDLAPAIPADLDITVKSHQNQSYQLTESQFSMLQSQIHIDSSTTTLSPDTYQFQPISPANSYSSGYTTPISEQHIDVQSTELFKILTAPQEYSSAVSFTEDELVSLHSDSNIHTTIAMEDLQSNQSGYIQSNSLFSLNSTDKPIQSLVASDDLESILSYNTISGSDSDEDYVPEVSSGRRSGKSRSRSNGVVSSDRKERKKQQNKDAATRYRMKKRAEAGLFNNDLRQLEDRNAELHRNVDQVTLEIQYLKKLMAEVNDKRRSLGMAK